MKPLFVLIIFLVVFQGFVSINLISPIHAQGLTLDQIKTNLLENPPATGDPVLREQTIIALDEILKNDSSRSSPSVADFYASMMEKVKNEIDEEVLAGVNIWMMYNHGFIVKTPEIVFAFDLIDGYCKQNLSSGVYMYQIVVDSFGESASFQDSKKMILLR